MSKVEFKLNRSGVREVLRSAGIMSVLEGEAQSRASRAGAGYGVSTYVGKNRCNAEIRPETAAARRDNLRNNTLLRTIT